MTFNKKDFEGAMALYRQWNDKINVVSRKDTDSLYEHHFLHSLSLAWYLSDVLGEDLEGKTFLDVGTGGGFPGIPLAMVLPQCHFTLCDSIGKKILVASNIAGSLGLTNVECVNARVETLEDSYDWVVSRAVTSLENFYPWVQHKYRRSILYLKGGDINTEISNLQKRFHLSPSLISTCPVSSFLGGDDYFSEKFIIEIKNR